jgi:hypothetical protein
VFRGAAYGIARVDRARSVRNVDGTPTAKSPGMTNHPHGKLSRMLPLAIALFGIASVRCAGESSESDEGTEEVASAALTVASYMPTSSNGQTNIRSTGSSTLIGALTTGGDDVGTSDGDASYDGVGPSASSGSLVLGFSGLPTTKATSVTLDAMARESGTGTVRLDLWDGGAWRIGTPAALTGSFARYRQTWTGLSVDPNTVQARIVLGGVGSRVSSAWIDLGTQVPAIAASYFAVGMNAVGAPLPARLGALRLWDSGVSWYSIETQKGVYDFSKLDPWLTKASAAGVEVLYTFGRTPTFASSSPSDQNCAFHGTNAGGQCDPPNDLAADGSGTNASYKAFVVALVGHLQKTGGKIHAFEVWNEVNNTDFWKGTAPQLVRMAADLRAIVKAAFPSAVVLSPSTCNCNNTSLTKSKYTTTNPQDGMDDYLGTSVGGVTGAALADAVAFHPYLGSASPEGLGALTSKMKAVLHAHGLDATPLWDTESSWGPNATIGGSGATATEAAAAFAARSFILGANGADARGGLARFYWYQWDLATAGTMWNGSVLPGGHAFDTVYGWLVGKSPVPCTVTSVSSPANSSDYACDYVKGDGSRARAVWNTHGSASYAVPLGFSTYRTLAGNTATSLPTNRTIAIGTSPVLVE